MDGRLVGNKDNVVSLPALDHMSQQGIVFRNTYSNNPICCPSRSALWSGLHTHITQSWNNYKGLPEGYPTWAVKLEQAGYTTKIIGKQDYTSGDHSVSNRVEAWTRAVNFTLRQEGRPTPVLVGNNSTQHVTSDWHLADEASEWLRTTAVNVDGPFLLYVGLNLPHPYNTPQEGENSGGSTFKTSPYWLNYVNESKVTMPNWIPLENMHPVDFYDSKVKNCTSNFTHDDIFKIRQYYYAMCAETDGMLGQILDALRDTGKENNSYVFFSSDHGEMAMEHRQFYKMTMYEASSHVPLVVTGPKVPNQQIEDVAQLIDIFPTFMDIAGIKHPPGLNGSSLMPFLKPDTHGYQLKDRPDYILSQYHGCNVNMSSYMIRTGDYKYVAYGNGPSQIQPHLFDLSTDPDELVDMGGEQKDIVQKMDALLRSLIDYPSVSKQVDEYNRASFKEWRTSLGTKYNNTIANLRWWMDWQKNPEGNQAKIDQWLQSVPET
jgi:arylsulfatase K